MVTRLVAERKGVRGAGCRRLAWKPTPQLGGGVGHQVELENTVLPLLNRVPDQGPLEATKVSRGGPKAELNENQQG